MAHSGTAERAVKSRIRTLSVLAGWACSLLALLDMNRLHSWVGVLFGGLLAACSGSGTPGAGGGGTGGMGSTSCESRREAAWSLLTEPASCSTDADCAAYYPPCQFPGVACSRGYPTNQASYSAVRSAFEAYESCANCGVGGACAGTPTAQRKCVDGLCT